MDKKIDPGEIVNPKATLARREAEAGTAPVGGLVPSTESTEGQRQFLYGGKPKAKPTPAEAERKRKSFDELQRKRDAELRASTNDFEEEFSKDSDVPLTDAVRAARVAVAEPRVKEDAEFASAYKEDKNAA